MSLTMYQASVPTFVQILTALSGVLDKGQAYATAKKFDPAILLTARLAPNMFPLSRQVQIACDFAKGASARLAGAEVPSWPDQEKTFAELQERIKKTVDFVRSFKAGADRRLGGARGERVDRRPARHLQGPAVSDPVRAAELLLPHHRSPTPSCATTASSSASATSSAPCRAWAGSCARRKADTAQAAPANLLRVYRILGALAFGELG